MSKPVAVRLDDKTREKIDLLAESMERSRSWIIAEAVAQYLVDNQWQVEAIEKGLREASAGESVSHGALKKKWERRLAKAEGDLDKKRRR